MPEQTLFEFGYSATRLRLETLVRLRWLAVAGQTAAVAIVYGVLGFPLPLAPCLLVIGVAAALNLALSWRYPVSHRLGENAGFGLLAFDIVQLGGLLFLTGGLENPFAMMFLAPVLISAAALPPMRTVGLGLLAVAVATALAFVHQPLPW